MKPPFSYFGGKQILIPHLLRLIPPHSTYVEVFGGSAALLFAKQPSEIEVYNDIDMTLANFFRVLKDEEKFRSLWKALALTPYSRAERSFAKVKQDCLDDIEMARRFFVDVTQSFAGCRNGGWGITIIDSPNGVTGTCARYLSAIARLEQCHKRLGNVDIASSDWRVILDAYDSSETLFYLDPPYVPSTWPTAGDGYSFELTVDDHKELVERLLSLRGMALVSGYESETYEVLEQHGWLKTEVTVRVRARRRRKRAVANGDATQLLAKKEIIWWNISPRAIGMLF